MLDALQKWPGSPEPNETVRCCKDFPGTSQRVKVLYYRGFLWQTVRRNPSIVLLEAVLSELLALQTV